MPASSNNTKIGGVRYLLVKKGVLPTEDYYFSGSIFEGACSIEKPCELTQYKHAEVIIFIRYITNEWRIYINNNKYKYKYILFIDDDLLDSSSYRNLTLPYQIKLYLFVTRHYKWLKAIGFGLWVSTEQLMEKYSDWGPCLVRPHLVELPKYIRVFYHGTSSHHDEAIWLYDVMAQVLSNSNNITFEIAADRKIKKLYKNLPNVSIVNPMSWVAYQSYLGMSKRNVGLAPLIPTRFNASRSYTKYFDITNANAVGIYAKGAIYDKVIKHDINGLLLEMNKDLWVKAIKHLASNDRARNKMTTNAINDVQELSEKTDILNRTSISKWFENNK